MPPDAREIARPPPSYESARSWIYAAAIAASALVLLVAVCPADAIDAVKAGIALPVAAWQILLPLVGLGVAAGATNHCVAAGAATLFAFSALAAGEPAEDYLLAHQDLLAALVRFPVTDCALALSAGAALVSCRGRAAGLVFPAALSAGVAYGLVIGIESPGDSATRWFAAAALLMAAAVVLVGLMIRRLAPGAGWRIAEKIFGSWLIAAGILLAGLALAPKPPITPDTDSIPSEQSPSPNASAP